MGDSDRVSAARDMLEAVITGDAAAAGILAATVNATAGSPIGALAVAAHLLAVGNCNPITAAQKLTEAAAGCDAAGDGGASAVLLLAARAMMEGSVAGRPFVRQPLVAAALDRLAAAAGEPPARLADAIAAGIAAGWVTDEIYEDREELAVVDALGLAGTHPAVRQRVADADNVSDRELVNVPPDVANDWALACCAASPYQVEYPVWIAINTDAPASYRVAAVLILARAFGQSFEARVEAAGLLSSRLGATLELPFDAMVEQLALFVIDALGERAAATFVLPPVII